MAEKIKNFFKRKKVEAKFKTAGPGHKLTESTSATTSKKKDEYKAPKRNDLSQEAKTAAEAAMARLGTKKKDSAFNTSFAAVRAQVKKELEAEQAGKTQQPKNAEVKELEASPMLAVQGVFFKCPLISNEVLMKNEWTERIRAFLYEQLEQEKGLTACLIIRSLNKNSEKVQTCIETLCKYIDNIVNNPSDDKYKRIRVQNRVFSERVQPIEGAVHFLNALGFEAIRENDEEFLVVRVDDATLERMQMLRDALVSSERIPLELDRNIQVLSPAQATSKVDLPSVFFNLTAEELKREQELKADVVEKSMQLRTKAMRERDEQREIRKYRFALIRVRFPDGIFLQGTFSVYETISAIFEFVRENLAFEGLPFQLHDATGTRVLEDDCDKTLIDWKLVPASILTFSWDPDIEIADEIAQHDVTYLKPELLMLMRTL